jgi:hypothetical protein
MSPLIFQERTQEIPVLKEMKNTLFSSGIGSKNVRKWSREEKDKFKNQNWKIQSKNRLQVKFKKENKKQQSF